MRFSRCPSVIMVDVFVVRDPSCSLASTARPLVASYNYGRYSVVLFLLYGRIAARLFFGYVAFFT